MATRSLTQGGVTKGVMEGVGVRKYFDFSQFTLPEFERNLGLYLLQALSPSPQEFYPVNSNGMLHRTFGLSAWKAERRHKLFLFVLPTLTIRSFLCRTI